MKSEKQTIRSVLLRRAVHFLVIALFLFVSYKDGFGQEHELETLKESVQNEEIGVLKNIGSHYSEIPDKIPGTRFKWRNAYPGEWYFEARYPVLYEDDQDPYAVHIMFTGKSKARNTLDVSTGLHTKLWRGLGVWHLQDFKPKSYEKYKSKVELNLSKEQMDGMYLEFQTVRNGKLYAIKRGGASENVILHWYHPNHGELFYWTSEFKDEKTGATYPIIVRVAGVGTKSTSLIQAYIKKYPSTMEAYDSSWWNWRIKRANMLARKILNMDPGDRTDRVSRFKRRGRKRKEVARQLIELTVRTRNRRKEAMKQYEPFLTAVEEGKTKQVETYIEEIKQNVRKLVKEYRDQ